MGNKGCFGSDTPAAFSKPWLFACEQSSSVAEFWHHFQYFSNSGGISRVFFSVGFDDHGGCGVQLDVQYGTVAHDQYIQQLLPISRFYQVVSRQLMENYGPMRCAPFLSPRTHKHHKMH